MSEVISKIEETQKLIKIQKHISAIETKLAEDRKKQTMFDPNDIAIWKSYVEALAVIKKSSEKLQAINLNSQDTILHNFFKNETDLQIERIISELFNLNGVSSKTNYRNFSHKFHPDKIAQLRKRVSASVVKDMRIEEKFKKVYGFITSAWDFYLKKNGNADEHTDNLMKRAMELGKTPDALWKAFDVEKAIKIIDQSIKHLEAKKNTLKQDMTYDEASEETLQNLERRKRKTMKMLGAIDQESLKHKTEAVKAEYHKTIEEARTEKEKVENYAKQIFADQVMRINEEKEKNNKKYKKERLLEYRKQEKAIADAKEKCSQRYREIRKAQDQTEQEFRDKRYEAYQIEEQDKKTAENVYHSEWKKIYDRKKIAIKNIEEKESQEWQDSKIKFDQAKKAAERVFDQERKKLGDTRDKLINDAEKIANQEYKKIKAPENTGAYFLEWNKILNAKYKIVKTAEDADMKEWRKLNDHKKKTIEEAERVRTKEYYEREKEEESAIKGVNSKYAAENEKLESEKNKAIKIAEEPYARIVKEEEESNAMFKKKIDQIFKEREAEIEIIKQGYSEFLSTHTETNDALDKKLEQAKICEKSAFKDAKNEFKRRKEQAEFKKDMMIKAINQLLEMESSVSVSEEPVQSAKSQPKQAIIGHRISLSNSSEKLRVNLEIPDSNPRGIHERTHPDAEKKTIQKNKRGMNLISEICPQPIIPAQKTLIHVICKDLVKDFREGLDTIFVTDLLKIARDNKRDDRIKEKIEFVSKQELLDRVSTLAMDPNNLVDVALSDMAFIEKLPENVKSLVFESDSSSNFVNIHGVLSALRALQNDDITTLTKIYKILTGRKFAQMEKLRSLDPNAPKYYQKLAKLIIFQLPPIEVHNIAELKIMNAQMLDLLKSA